MQIPRFSEPLIKDIRTGEGIFEWLTGLAIAASALTDKLSYSHSATYVAILAGIKAVRRCLLKLVATQMVMGYGAPTLPTALTSAEELLPASIVPTLAPDVPPLESSIPGGPQTPEG
jgi:hypothetical protein